MHTPVNRTRFGKIEAGNTLAFPGGGTAVVRGIGPEYQVLTRSYHQVTLTDPDGGNVRTEPFARMSWWDVLVK